MSICGGGGGGILGIKVKDLVFLPGFVHKPTRASQIFQGYFCTGE
jgi:hypothetical protein